MGLPLTDKHYNFVVKKRVHVWPDSESYPIWENRITIYRKRPKFPKGKAEIKAEKRRTHRRRHYHTIKTLRKLQLQLTETTSYYLENANV